MKIALLISGMFRHFEECYPTIEKNIIDTTNCDVFVDTWKHSSKTRQTIVDNNEISKKQIKSIKNLKKYRIEKNFLFKEGYTKKFKYTYAGSENFLYMAYKMRQCFKLMEKYEKKNNFQYDVVIRSRIDLYFQRSLTLEKIKCAIDKNEICFPECQTYDGINDQFFYSNRENIRLMSNVSKHIRKLAKQVEFNPEKLLFEHAKNKNIKLKCFPCKDVEYTHYVLSHDRGNGYFVNSKCFSPNHISYESFINSEKK